MKIRNGFVSNSSSSSFVVAFPHKPTSVEDLKTMMFGKQEWHFGDIYTRDGDADVSTLKIAESVFADIKKKATKKEIFESIRNGYFGCYLDESICPGHYDTWDETKNLDYKKDRKKIDAIYKKGEKINNQRASEIVRVFLSTNKDKFIVVLSYADDDSWGSILEHSGIFQRLEHIRTSYH